MANSECKARALYDFRAEGPSELSLTTGEIIVITSGTNGNDWWYGQNASGQFGAVPATYVQILNEDFNASEEQVVDVDRVEEETTLEQSTEHDFITDSSFDSLSSSTIHDPLSNPLNSLDPYKTIIDPSTSNITSDQSTQNEQRNSLLGDLLLPSPTSTTDYQYDRSSSLFVPMTSNGTIPMNIPSSSDDRVYENTLSDQRQSRIEENLPTSPTTTNKPERTRLFSFTQRKPKSDLDKRRGSIDTVLNTPSKHDSDSDGQSEFGSSPNTYSTSNKSPSSGGGGGDSRTPTLTRFFDRHGVGNYLLHELKTKPEEHVEIIYDENEGGICWSINPIIPPFTCKIEKMSKETKFSGLKSFVEYKIHAQISGSRVIGRRYKQFDWLHEQLVNKYRFICIPPLPTKQLAGRFEQEFLEERRRQLELWLNRICRHPILCASFPVQHFVTCELTEKNNKDWKAGKRKVERDEFRESSWLHCVTLNNLNFSDTELLSQIDAFAQQQPGLEIHLKNLNQGFSKYLERHSEIYERDLQRVGELFTKLHLVIQTDTTTSKIDDLSNSMSKISQSYNGIAELYRTKGYESIRDFVERIQEYVGLLACFPIIISIHRSATEFIRNAQQRGSSSTPDLTSAIHRHQILNYVILAEINFFQKAKVKDLNIYMKSFLDEQILFYNQITSELRDARTTFH